MIICFKPNKMISLNVIIWITLCSAVQPVNVTAVINKMLLYCNLYYLSSSENK